MALEADDVLGTEDSTTNGKPTTLYDICRARSPDFLSNSVLKSSTHSSSGDCA